MTRLFRTCICAGALLIGLTAHAQPPEAQDGPRAAPLYLLSELAETLGRAHAVRTLCNGDQDGTWRNYMLNLMSYEAPSGPRRAALTEAFNRGFRSQTRDTPNCNGSSSRTEAQIAARGKELADTIARTYMD
ncbi:MAG: TIGR02301 family protein [Hyphomonadaceae bacterium]